MRLFPPLSVPLAAVVLLTGCSSVEAGTPSSQADASESDTGASGRPSTTSDSVPAVDDPLDASAYEDKPCDLLAEDFLDDLGFTESGDASLADDGGPAADVGPSCEWDVSGGIDSIFVQVQTGNRDAGSGGIVGPYEAHESGDMAYWNPVTVSDYPAVFAGRTDNRDNGECSMFVGIRDDLTFSVISGPIDDKSENACRRTKRVAEHVIDTLEGSQ